jgi:hypothetical protein
MHPLGVWLGCIGYVHPLTAHLAGTDYSLPCDKLSKTEPSRREESVWLHNGYDLVFNRLALPLLRHTEKVGNVGGL